MSSRANERAEVERVAKLLHKAYLQRVAETHPEWNRHDLAWDAIRDWDRENYLHAARAVLADRAATKGAKKR